MFQTCYEPASNPDSQPATQNMFWVDSPEHVLDLVLFQPSRTCSGLAVYSRAEHVLECVLFRQSRTCSGLTVYNCAEHVLDCVLF